MPPVQTNEGAVSESEESARREPSWLYRTRMHARIRCAYFMLRLLGEEHTEIRDLLAENRRLRKQVRTHRKQQRKNNR